MVSSTSIARTEQTNRLSILKAKPGVIGINLTNADDPDGGINNLKPRG